MLDTILANALEGFTIVEDEAGAVGLILANQMGTYAEAGGKRVGHLSMEESGLAGLADETAVHRASDGEDMSISRNARSSQKLLGLGQRYVVRENADLDLMILDDMSVYLYDKTVREVIDVVKFIRMQVKQKRSFIVPLERTVIGERTSSYLKSHADSVIIVRSEISSDRVLRSLYIQKMRNSYPGDRLVKFTLDENGIQVDTREFLG
jgi:archaellum biogenesis ATPase FlaH